MSAENGGTPENEVTSYSVDEQGIALIRLERPQARNAIDTQMLLELLEHLAVARGDEAVRVLVISSADHLGLSAGADVREQLDDEGKVRRMQLFADLYDAVVAFPKPTIAACHGDVVGGGAEIAVACDMRVGGSNLRMRFPGAALGVPVGPARLVTLCGLATAKY
ncbi:MAG TPA: enoyl-CoA hydratase/isomerase family protein, partial [Solirubrobacterales bacterium]|nr:enoyl-CoA hydratase/isomerase family protein [Solirubrobacterales bacterium]